MTLPAKPPASFDWRFVLRSVATGLTILIFLRGLWPVLGFFLESKGEGLFVDAHVYFRATSNWVNGHDPWAAEWFGIPYAAPPPTLLLNLPLLWLGENLAVAVWVAASTLAVGYLIWRLRLPIYWALFLPISEAWLAASPDLVLAALVLAGAGGISAVAKAYAIPAMVAERRWRALAVGGLLFLFAAPWLPWIAFFDASESIAAAFDQHTLVVSSFGHPALMLVTALALISLGWRDGFMLVTPALLAQQPHYLLFSLPVLKTSRILYWAAAIPLAQVMAFAAIGYSIWVRLQPRIAVRIAARSAAPVHEATA